MSTTDLSPKVLVLNSEATFRAGIKDLLVAVLNESDQDINVFAPEMTYNCMLVFEDGSAVPHSSVEEQAMSFRGKYVPVRARSLVLFEVSLGDRFQWNKLKEGSNRLVLAFNSQSSERDSWTTHAKSSPHVGLTLTNPFVVTVLRGKLTGVFGTEPEVGLDRLTRRR